MSSCLCPTSACTGQDICVLVLAARTSLVPTCHSSRVWAKQDESQSAPGAAPQHTVCGERS